MLSMVRSAHHRAYVKTKANVFLPTLCHSGCNIGLVRLHGCQVFISCAGNFLNGSVVGKAGFRYPERGGLVFETQNWPNFVNTPAFPQWFALLSTAHVNFRLLGA